MRRVVVVERDRSSRIGVHRWVESRSLRKTCIVRSEWQKSVIVNGGERQGSWWRMKKGKGDPKDDGRSTKNIIQWRGQGKRTTNTKDECYIGRQM